MEWFFIVLLVVGVVGLLIQQSEKKSEAARRQRADEDRRATLSKRYANDPFGADVLRGQIRPGMTVQHLVDAWGQPAAIEERVLKTKVVHTYKYAQTGARSFRQRVKVENGIIVGWTNT